jgi:hypothetical protein
MLRAIVHYAHKKHPLVFVDTGSAGFRCNGCGCHGVSLDTDATPATSTCTSSARRAQRLRRSPSTVSIRSRSSELCSPMTRGYATCAAHLFRACTTAAVCAASTCTPCSQLPVTTVSPLRPAHLLVLTVATPVKCTRCSTSCVWRYWCVPCKVNLHPGACSGLTRRRYSFPKACGLSTIASQVCIHQDQVNLIVE